MLMIGKQNKSILVLVYLVRNPLTLKLNKGSGGVGVS
jgi:hypothetical protein